MDTPNQTQALLAQIPRPGFLVEDNRLAAVNQAAQALLLEPGMDFLPLLSGQELPAFSQGQLCLTLTIGGLPHNATILKMEDGDLVLLDSPDSIEEYRAMALVSMQLRKPLMQAIANAQKLEAEASASMNRSLMQLLRLVGNLSDIGRYTGAARMEVRDVDSFFLELFEKADALTGSTLSIRYQGLGYPIFSQIDPEQLERAVWNLLSNCIRFTPAGGSITAVLTRRGKFLSLTLEDTGSGIAEQIHRDLFQRYLRQPGLEDSRFGLGLGLAIVRACVSNHGGTLLICSGKEGGAKITMTLALRQEDGNLLRAPLFRLDYAGGFDHALVELSDCLGPEYYETL